MDEETNFQAYDQFSITQLNLMLANLTSSNEPIHKKKVVKATLDVIVDRAVAAEGKHSRTQGEFYKTIGNILDIKPYRVEEYYQSEGPVKNQLEKILQVIKFTERHHPDYFTQENLIQRFGEKEGKAIRARYDIVKDKHMWKNNSFVKNSLSQEADLEVLVLRDEKRKRNSRGLPEIIVLKKGKSAESIMKKAAKYLKEKLHFIESPDLSLFQPYLAVAQHLEGTTTNNTTTDLLSDVTIGEKATLESNYRSWKNTTRLIVAEQNDQDRYIKTNIKNAKPKERHDKNNAFKIRIRELKKEQKEQEQAFIKSYRAIKKKINKTAKQLQPEALAKYNNEVIYDLGNLSDTKGFQLILKPKTLKEINEDNRRKDQAREQEQSITSKYKTALDVYKKRVELAENYNAGTLEDHREERERKTNIAAIHAKFHATRYRHDEQRSAYAHAEVFEGQALSIDDEIKDLLGNYNHTDYQTNKEAKIFDGLNDTQKKLFSFIIKRLSWIAGTDIIKSNPEKGEQHGIMENAFRTLHQLKSYQRATEQEYQDRLEQETNTVMKKLYAQKLTR